MSVFFCITVILYLTLTAYFVLFNPLRSNISILPSDDYDTQKLAGLMETRSFETEFKKAFNAKFPQLLNLSYKTSVRRNNIMTIDLLGIDTENAETSTDYFKSYLQDYLAAHPKIGTTEEAKTQILKDIVNEYRTSIKSFTDAEINFLNKFPIESVYLKTVASLQGQIFVETKINYFNAAIINNTAQSVRTGLEFAIQQCRQNLTENDLLLLTRSLEYQYQAGIISSAHAMLKVLDRTLSAKKILYVTGLDVSRRYARLDIALSFAILSIILTISLILIRSTSLEKTHE